MSVFFVQPIFALYVDEMLGNPEFVATAAGAIFSVAGLFTVISAPWWGRRNDRKNMRKNLSLAFLGAGIAYGLHAVATHIAPLIALRALLGFSLGGMLPVLYSYVSKFAPPNRRGGILGIATSGNTLANFIGAPLGGLIGAHLGLRSVFLFAFGMLLISIWVVRTNLVDAPDDHGDDRTPAPVPIPDRSPSESSSA
jgi:predicted MFS family arabinose efflux permease